MFLAFKGNAYERRRFGMIDKINHTVNLASIVIDKWSIYKINRDDIVRSEVDKKLTELLEFMLDNYVGGFSVDDLKLVFDYQGDLLSSDYLSHVPQGIIPIAIMRQVMGKNRVIVSRKRIPIWETFSKRYGDYIVQF